MLIKCLYCTEHLYLMIHSNKYQKQSSNFELMKNGMIKLSSAPAYRIQPYSNASNSSNNNKCITIKHFWFTQYTASKY